MFRLVTKRGVAKAVAVAEARDVVITFGQHTGQRLGALPTGYLKLLASNSNSEWRSLADDVLSEREGTSSAISFHGDLEKDSLFGRLQNATTLDGISQIHRRILDSSHMNNTDLLNSLIKMYGKLGSLEDAKAVFDGMMYQNHESWSTMISAYAQNGQLDTAKSTFDGATGTRDVEVWNSLLSAYACSGHCEEAKMVFERMPSRSTHSLNRMVKLYVDTRAFKAAKALFHSSAEKDVLTYNIVLHTFARKGHCIQVQSVFNKMPAWSAASWTFLIHGFSVKGDVENATLLFSQCPKAKEATIIIMVRLYSYAGRTMEAKALFDQWPREKSERLWTSLLSGYVMAGLMEEAKASFDTMPRMISRPWTLMVAGYGQVLCVEDSETIFDKMPEWNVVAWNAMLEAYIQVGHLQMANIMLSRMPSRDVKSWSVVLEGNARLGMSSYAMRLFRRMQLEGYVPDAGCYSGVLTACRLDGLIDEGRDYFVGITQDYAGTPSSEHWMAMVEILSGKRSHLEAAAEVMDLMPFVSDANMWETLLAACCRHRDAKQALKVARRVMAIEPGRSRPYEILARTHALNGDMAKAALIRKIMKERGVSQEEQILWTCIGGKLHRVTADDISSHSQSDAILNELHRLVSCIEQLGYCPDGEVDNKHCEKLAVAFANIFKNRDVRMVSNSRVCEDCHHALKLLSKVINKNIVLRSSSTIHYFDQGCCSCHDLF